MKLNCRNLIDVRQTTEYARFMTETGWQVKTVNKINIFIKRLPFLPFSVLKVLRFPNPNNKNFMNRVKKISKKNWVLITKFQPLMISKSPKKNFKSSKLKEDKNPLIPTKTIWLNLYKNNSYLLKQMSSKTRYNIRLAQKKKVKTIIIPGNKIKPQTLNDFYQLWKKNRPFNWLFKPSFKNLQVLVKDFGKKCFFVLASNNELIAGALILTSKNMASYWHNCSNKQGKKLFAPTLIMWRVIKEAKKRGLRIFDFEGIYDSRFHQSTKNWQGFSKFKKGFGGKELFFSKPFRDSF